MMISRLIPQARVLAAVAMAGQACAANAATIVGKFNEWTLYANGEQQKICFVASAPSQTDPANLQRDPTLLYVSAWPKEGVKSEISLKLGFPPKKASEPTITISGATQGTFKLFIKEDRAFIADTTQELKLLDAMKRGSKLTVQSTSERGTTVTDTYTLNGVTAALQALAVGCP